MRWFVRQKRPVISNEYEAYILEHECDSSIYEDPVSLEQAVNSDNFDKWFDAKKEELKLIDDNKVWDLVELPKWSKRVGYKWVFKTKCDSNSNIERNNAWLVTKGYT